MKVVIIGANGQLGSDLLLALRDLEVIPVTRPAIDVTDLASVQTVLSQHRPDVVINTAAFHRVDDIEDDPWPAFRVNALGAYHMALACREIGAALVHFSTDYVFDGRKTSPYVETDAPNPINAYGVSKLAGEHLVRYVLPHHYIIRTAGLFGVMGSSGKGGNFVETMIRLGREREVVRVVDDQVMCPTYTMDLATTVGQLIRTGRYGLYHITNTGACTWYTFARAIFEATGASARLEPTTTEAFGARADRPRYSVLAHTALLAAGLPDLRPWPEALAAYLEERQHRGPHAR